MPAPVHQIVLTLDGLTIFRSVVAQHFFGATRAPTANDDANDGYSPSSIWIWPGNGTWVCQDNVVGAAVWQQVGASGTVSGAFSLPGVVSAVITADQDDWAPAGLDAATTLKITPNGGSWAVKGIAGGTAGRVLVLRNEHPTNRVKLYSSSSTTPANSFDFGFGLTKIITPGGSVVLWYNGATSRWDMMAATSATDGDIADLMESAGNILVSGGTIYGSQPVTGDIVSSGVTLGQLTVGNNKITDAKLRTGAATSVVGRSALSTGNVADIAASSDGQVLRRSGGTLGFGTAAIAGGGTGQTTASAAFDALSPTTTKGDLIADDGSVPGRLAVGSDGQVLTADSTQAKGVKWAAPSAGGPDVQVFPTNGSYTWTKPAGKTYGYALCIGAGGGGGSGRRGAGSTGRFGGGGGAGGCYAEFWFPLSAAAATETVTVGMGGLGGSAIPFDSTNGANGGAGGDSSLTINALSPVVAKGGGFGAGGSAAAAAGGAPGGVAQWTGGTGADGVAGGIAVAATPSSGNLGKAGGGGGGGSGLSSTNTAGTASNGGYSSGGEVAAFGATGANGSAGKPTSTLVYLGGGGGGGGGTNGGTGGAGGLRGGGGGGGGASLNGTNSGAGGAGADGVVVVVCW